jgi:superfamily II DNA or RNA helicase
MSQSQKTLEFLQKLKDSGHWNDDYDYSEVLYVNSNNKVIVIDKKWGSKHLIFPHKLLNNNSKCSLRNCINPDKLLEIQFNSVHNYKYDYSNVKYQGSTSEVIIICKKHGEFRKKVNHHLRGMGCNKCSGGIRFAQEGVIDYLKKNNPNNYDFSNVKYKNSKTKIIIIDPKFHSKHLMTFESYKNGVKCSLVNAVNKTNYLIKKFKVIHKNTYNYDKVNYVSENKKVTISCKIHGDFNQTAKSHIHGSGCPKCKGKGFSRSEIINQLNIIHNNKYDYSKIDYKSLNSKVIIICKKHGEFIQKLSNHKRGDGCRKCAGLEITTKEILQKFKAKHGNRYDYSKVEYKSALSKVKIICKEHGVFTSTANNHIYGTGCPTCSRWTQENIIRFINDIRNEDILNMDPVELNMLIAQGKLPKEFEELVFTLEGTKENSLKTLKEKLGIEEEEELSEDRTEELSDKLEELTSSYDEELNDAISAIEAPSIEDVEYSEEEQRKRQGLPSISNEDILVLDKELIGTCDDEAVEFFIQYKLKKVWNEVINDKREADDIKVLNGGKNSSRLRDLFLEEYEKVVNYTPPPGYAFPYQPNMMQKLTVQRVKDYKRYGNWSGTGAGKTISFIVASREIDSRLTVVICLNSTVSQLEEDILDVYPDSLVHSNFKKGQKFDRSKFNYLLLNYEKFQQGYTEEIFQDLNENNLIDFIVLDEVHNSKQRDKNESLRRAALMRLIGRSAEMNTNFHLLGMSATPVINNLIEAKSLLKLITGKKYEDINTRGTISNALKIFNQLLLNGIRYIPKYDIILKELTAENTPTLNIDGADLTDKLKDNSNKDYLGLEKILLESKLTVLGDYLKPKTIIYTYFTDKDRIPKRVAKYVKSKGYSHALYIGEQSTEEREQSKRDFIEGEVDILIASRTIGTGVDGLQNICNRMVLLTLPWTDSEYTQLKGRIYRQGSKFGDVEIIIPQVFVDLDDKRWSWDKQRLQLIREKRTLADAAVDGVIPSKHIPSRQKLCSDSLQALKSWKERVNDGKITSIERKDLVLPLRPEIVEYLKPTLGDFSEMNKSWSTSRSENTFKRLKNNQKEWFYYHDMYKKRREDWDEIPYIEIAKKIKERPEWIVADMGCGENLLSKEVTNKVHAFDYVAIDKDVTACDMSSIPLRDNEIDAIVFSLSLMGSNYLDYIKEASRVVKLYGNIFICEPKKKVEKRLEVLKKEIKSTGFKIVEVNKSSQFIYIHGIKL